LEVGAVEAKERKVEEVNVQKEGEVNESRTEEKVGNKDDVKS